jgi:hypothetical protein
MTGVAELTAEGRRALEAKVGTESLDDLQEQRRQLLAHLAPLKALHGHGGLWDDKRKQYLEAQKIAARTAIIASGNLKPTEGLVDATAYGSEAYEKFLSDGENARIDYIMNANELTEIEEKIRSRELDFMIYNADTRLAR